MKLLVTVVLLAGLASAQTQAKGKAPVIMPTAPNPGGLFFPLPPEVKGKIRDRQYERQHLEIEKQQMLVTIAQIERRQDALDYEMQGIVFDFASEKHIDLTQFHLDPRQAALLPNEKKP